MTLTESTFLNLLNDYDFERPKRGQFLDGIVSLIESDSLLIDLGGKEEAIVDRDEFKRTDPTLLAGLRQGDTVPVFVVRTGSGANRTQVSIRLGLQKKDWDQAQADCASGAIHELPVIGSNKGGLLLAYRSLEAFVPTSLVPILRRMPSRELTEEQKNRMVGETLAVKVVEVDAERRRLICSAKAIEDSLRREQLLALAIGQSLTGTVVNLVDFGVFVNFGALDGLVHISELAWEPVEHPRDLFSIGDEIQVKVLSVNLKEERVSLSRKALLPEPVSSESAQSTPEEEDPFSF